MKILVTNIIVKERVRDDIGNLESLTQSIEKFGLLNPITVSEKNELIAGYRRLCAVKALGWDEIECNVVKPKSKLDSFDMEMAENQLRKDFTPEEILKSIEMRKRLSANLFKRFLFWLKKVWDWIKSLFTGKK